MVAFIHYPISTILRVTPIGLPVILLVCLAEAVYTRLYTGTSIPYCQSGQSFVQMMCNTKYGHPYICFCLRKVLYTPGKYDVYLKKEGGDSGLHWALVLKMKSLRIHLPYLSVEINTDKNRNLIPTLSERKDLPTAAKFMGCVDTTIAEVCEMADTVQCKMGNYQITSRNCQTFCNELLEKMDLPKEQTTCEGIKGTLKAALKHSLQSFTSR